MHRVPIRPNFNTEPSHFRVLTLRRFVIRSGVYCRKIRDARPQALVAQRLNYTLSISIYFIAWISYGAVGYAARSGLEFLTISLLVMSDWWWVLRKLVRTDRSQRITSIADLLSSRFRKSNSLAALITFLAMVGTTSYIALQLQSVTLFFEVFAASGEVGERATLSGNTAFWVAIGLSLFTIVFGIRNLDVNERHHSVVIAITVEVIVKLFTLLAVGVFVVWWVMGGIGQTFAKIDQSSLAHWSIDNNNRWASLTFLSEAFLKPPHGPFHFICC